VRHLIHRLSRFTSLSDEEARRLGDAAIQTVRLGPEKDVVRAGDHPEACHVLLDGFACRYKLLPDGKRQILAFSVPGDLLDLDGFIAGPMNYNVGTLAPCTLAVVPHAALLAVTTAHPRLARALWRDTALDAAIFAEWVANVGRRSAYQRIAHLLCEVFTRLTQVGLAREAGFDWPVTQAKLGDATGLSDVHVNRVLGELRRDGLIRLHGRSVLIDSWDGLRAVGGFDPGYLCPDPDHLASGLNGDAGSSDKPGHGS